jgi:hypothetical protein
MVTRLLMTRLSGLLVTRLLMTGLLSGLLVTRLLVLVLVELHRLAALHVLAVVFLDLVGHGNPPCGTGFPVTDATAVPAETL